MIVFFFTLIIRDCWLLVNRHFVTAHMEKAFIDISCIIIMVYIALQRLPLMRPHSLSKGFQVVYLFNIV